MLDSCLDPDPNQELLSEAETIQMDNIHITERKKTR